MTVAATRPLTTRTRVSLAIARALAASRGDRDLTPIHVAAGIFREGANPAIAALWSAGIEPRVLQRLGSELERTLGTRPGQTDPRQVAVDLTPGEESLLARGEQEAQTFGDDFLGTEHLMLAILRDTEAEPTPFLSQRGITAEVLTRGLAASRSGQPPE